MKYVYMTIRESGVSLCTSRKEAMMGAREVYRVSYGYSKDGHHCWDFPTFMSVGKRIFPQTKEVLP